MSRRPGTPSMLRAINERAALGLLLDNGPLTRTQLGELTGLSKVTASQLLTSLQSRGLVEVVGATVGWSWPQRRGLRRRAWCGLCGGARGRPASCVGRDLRRHRIDRGRGRARCVRRGGPGTGRTVRRGQGDPQGRAQARRPARGRDRYAWPGRPDHRGRGVRVRPARMARGSAADPRERACAGPSPSRTTSTLRGGRAARGGGAGRRRLRLVLGRRRPRVWLSCSAGGSIGGARARPARSAICRCRGGRCRPACRARARAPSSGSSAPTPSPTSLHRHGLAPATRGDDVAEAAVGRPDRRRLPARAVQAACRRRRRSLLRGRPRTRRADRERSGRAGGTGWPSASRSRSAVSRP